MRQPWHNYRKISIGYGIFAEVGKTAFNWPEFFLRAGRVAVGDCSPTAPTDPDVR
jgi:hypothetical protein